MRQPRRHHRPGVSLADGPLGLVACLSLSEGSLPLLFLLRAPLSDRLRTRTPLPLRISSSSSTSSSLSCSFSRPALSYLYCRSRYFRLALSHYHKRTRLRAGVTTCAREVSELNAWNRSPRFDSREGLYKVYEAWVVALKVSRWIDDTVGKGQLALSKIDPAPRARLEG